MRDFLRRLTVVASILGVLLALLVVACNLIINKKASFKIPAADTLVLFGHFHSEFAYNDTLIPGFKNLGSGGEAYFYTFRKMENVLAQNPQIRTVFIEFSNNQVTRRMNDWIWADSYMEAEYPIYAPFIPLQDHRYLFTHNFRGYINSSSFALKQQMISILANDYAYSKLIGRYFYTTANKVDSLIAVQHTMADTVNYALTSPDNIRYLKACIDLCRAHGKKVWLVRTPTHQDFPVLKNEQLFQEIRNKHFGDVPFLDFSAFPIRNTELADLEHLNCYGASRFSAWVDKMLKGGLLSQPAQETKNFIHANMPM